ncbi:MAG: flavin reductase family protein [Pseudomonadota bacterium]
MTSDTPPDTAAPRDDFLAALRRVPEPVTVVASRGPAGPGAITVSAFSSVSADPPTVLICLQSKGSAAAAVIENGCFTVNFLSDEDKALAELCAGRTSGDQPGSDHSARLAAEGWHTGADGLPRWGKAIAVLTCALHKTVEIGSHCVLIARVTRAETGPGESALLYQGRDFHKLSGPV